MRRRLAALVLASFAAPATAHVDQDVQAWLVFNATGSLSGRLLGSVEAVTRASNDQSRITSFEQTAMLGYKLSNAASLWGGAGLSSVVTLNGGRLYLHRGRQQLLLSLGKLGRVSLTARGMVEERWALHNGGAGVRVRAQLKGQLPLKHSHLSLFASGEGIDNLNATRWGQRTGFDRIRATAGVSVPLAHRLRADLGLLDDYQFRRNAPDREIHALLATFAFTF